MRAGSTAKPSKRVLAGLKEKLLAPNLVAAFIEEFERELKLAQRQSAGTTRELRARASATTQVFELIRIKPRDGLLLPSQNIVPDGDTSRAYPLLTRHWRSRIK